MTAAIAGTVAELMAREVLQEGACVEASEEAERSERPRNGKLHMTG
jgi:hypothetical protein